MILEPIKLKPLADKFKLRNVQEKSLPMIRESMRQGNDKIVVHIPPAGGKTVLAGMIAYMMFKKTPTAQFWFIVNRNTLLEQTKEEFEQFFNFDCGIVQSEYPLELDKHIQIATIQTLTNRLTSDRPTVWQTFNSLPVKLVVVDECFVGETLIDTPLGEKRIMDMSPGDIVYNALGAGIIEMIKTSITTTLVEVKLSNGKIIKCTENHPFFTSAGWVTAGKLVRGQRVFSKKGVSCLRDNVFTERGGEAEGQCTHSNRKRITVDQKTRLFTILLEETEESHALKGIQRKNVGHIEKDGAQAANTGRKRKAGINTSVQSLAGIGGRVDHGSDTVYGEKRMGGREATPISLQNRYCEQGFDDSNRGGRNVPSHIGKERAGQEKDGCADMVGVDSVTVIQQESGCPVYNLRVSGHPSYYAGGVLVHNCHLMFKGYETVYDAWGTKMLGLTGTPFSKGMGLFWDDMIRPETMVNLIKNEVLCDYQVKACVQINRNNLSVASTGEYVDKDVETEVSQIIGDVYQEWKDSEDMQGRPFIAFARTISTCIALAEKFTSHGKRVAYVHSKMSNAHVQAVLDAFKNGEYIGVFSVVKLVEGFNFPEVSAILMCAPLAPSKYDPNIPNSCCRYVQQPSRGLRIHDSKNYLLIHDHVGNFKQYGNYELIENLFPTLDMGKKTKRVLTPKERMERVPRICSKCGMEIKGSRCTVCGIKPEKPTQFLEAGDIEYIEGKMVEIKKKPITGKEQRKKEMDWPAKIKVFGQIKQYCKDKAKISGKPEWRGHAAHMWKGYMGTWPNDKRLQEAPMIPVGENIGRWIQSRNIAYAKQKGT